MNSNPIFGIHMQLYTTVRNLQKSISQNKQNGQKIAFVPTMGALHAGHLSLVKKAKQHADLVVVSIFINPSQFNNQQDLLKYPRMLEQDAYLLEQIDCEILFVPLASEVYPAGLNPELKLELGILDQVLEGEFRPGHFKGMLEVVYRLLDIVQPDILIMGQKDFQQFTLVFNMIRQLKIPVQLIIGETLRESDGLAMSSRNMRLSAEMRKIVPIIYQVLLELKNQLYISEIDDLLSRELEKLNASGLITDYLRIVDGISLEPVLNPKNHDCIVACVACWAGDVRLIDNLVLKGPLH
ncbi:MAG TPA: pantoate--beta-alanine ligase [Saprospiraceae bacterium]|nr:pantoate--beta-alanine ligase [Saprospiraceae bacterium]